MFLFTSVSLPTFVAAFICIILWTWYAWMVRCVQLKWIYISSWSWSMPEAEMHWSDNKDVLYTMCCWSFDLFRRFPFSMHLGFDQKPLLCFYISLSVCKAWVGWATKAPRWPWMMMMQCLWMWGSLCQTWWRCFHTPLLTDNSLSENRGKAKRDRECMGKEDKSCEWRTKREQKGKKCSQLYRRRGDNILSFYFM